MLTNNQIEFYIDQGKTIENTKLSKYEISGKNFTTIPDKIFGTKWSNPVKLDRKRKFYYLFLRVF